MSTDEQKSDVAEKLDNLVQEFFIDRQVELANAEETGERIDLWPEEIDVPVQLLSEAATTITALQERIKELEGALRPFAERADIYNEVPGLIRFDDSCQLWQLEENKGMRVTITIGQLRTARSTLKDSGNGSEVAR